MLDGVGIVELRNILHGRGQLCPGASIHLDGFLHQIHVEPNASVVDFLIDAIFIPDKVWYREIGKALLDRHLNLDVPLVICLEGFPLLRIMEGHVTGAASVGFCRSAGHGEVFDERFALVHLLIFELQHLTDAFKGKRQSHCGRPDHRALPAFRI